MNTRKQIKSLIFVLLLVIMPLALVGCESTQGVSQGLQKDIRISTADLQMNPDIEGIRMEIYN